MLISYLQMLPKHTQGSQEGETPALSPVNCPLGCAARLVAVGVSVTHALQIVTDFRVQPLSLHIVLTDTFKIKCPPFCSKQYIKPLQNQILQVRKYQPPVYSARQMEMPASLEGSQSSRAGAGRGSWVVHSESFLRCRLQGLLAACWGSRGESSGETQA